MLFGKPKNFDPSVLFGAPKVTDMATDDKKEAVKAVEDKEKFFIPSEFKNGMKIMGRRTREQAQMDVPMENGEEKVTETLKQFK